MRAHPRFAFAAALFTLSAIAVTANAADDKTDDKKAGDAPAAGAGAATSAAPPKQDATDVTEVPGKKYYFVGIRYRHTIIPKFIENLFVKEGATVHSNSFGVEFDIRKDEMSLIPSINYAEFGTDDILFLQANKPATDPGNWSYINSSLKSIHLGLDILWTVYQPSPKIQFEAGIGFAFGAIFGDLVNNWVTSTPQGGRAPDFVASDGSKFWKCQTQNDGAGCAIGNHSGATTAKVGNFVEPSWFNGGSMPPIYAHFVVPEISMRFKPVKQFAGRLGLGFTIPTGFWFGLSADYGLEQPDKKGVASTMPRVGMR